MKKLKSYSLITCFIIIPSFFLTRCKKLVEVDSPVTKLEASNVYEKDATAIAVMTGIYIKMSNAGGYATGASSISLITGLSADELIAYSGTQRLLAYRNALTSASSPGVPFWSILYNHIYTTNTAIQSLMESISLTPAVRKQLIGEAKFIRALLYFYLVNLWGDVPLAISNDFVINNNIGRTAKDQVYHQIIADLEDAQSQLSTDFLASDLLSVSSERIRPTKWAAAALLARVYLFTGNWLKAESKATDIITNRALFDTVGLNNVFLKNSKEAIWQLQPVSPGWNTEDAKAFILTAVPGNIQSVSLSKQLLNAFEIGDKRIQEWVKGFTFSGSTYYYPYKYKVNLQNAALTEYLMVLRLGEQYLIRAEARAQQGKLIDAISDLNAIRRRANLPLATPANQTDLINAITHERQVELFTEWGHRWLDLKRSGNVNPTMGVVTTLKGGNWKPEWALYPIPQSDIQNNPALIQNPGYQ